MIPFRQHIHKVILLQVAILILLSPGTSLAQKQGNNWYFGRYAGITFNSGFPIPVSNGVLNTSEGCSGISDELGQNLFYTDGISVFNMSHNMMANGDGLCGHNTSSQSGLIVKQPGSSKRYYIFSVYQDFCYSIVDMNQDNGLGAVIVKNVILVPNIYTEKQCATRHANGRDVWIIVRDTDKFYAYLLTDSGLTTTPVVSTEGLTDLSKLGQMKTTAHGDKIAYGIFHGPAGSPNVNISKIDNATGMITDSYSLSNGYIQTYGIEFSPDGNILYTTGYTSNGFYQYDLSNTTQSAIQASMVNLGSTALGIGALQIGPNRKIYGALNNGHYLAVINEPDIPGLSCDFVHNGLYLAAGTSQIGLPEFISDYYISPPPDDTTEISDPIHIIANPVSGYISVQNDLANNPYIFTVYDMQGRLVMKQNVNSAFHVFSISSLAAAVYAVEVTTKKEKIVKKILKL